MSDDHAASGEPDGQILNQVVNFAVLLEQAREIAGNEARRQIGRAALAGATASDVAQSVVKHLVVNGGRLRFSSPAEFVAMVRGIAVRHVANKLRQARAKRRDVRQQAALTSEVAEGLAAATPSPSAAASAREWIALVDRALARLRPVVGDVVRLRLRGHSHEDIAAMLDITVDNSTKIWTRARTQLARLLDPGDASSLPDGKADNQ